jgi:hypothetical protein
MSDLRRLRQRRASSLRPVLLYLAQGELCSPFRLLLSIIAVVRVGYYAEV